MKWLLFFPSVAFAQVTPIEIIPIPEPGTVALIALGFGVMLLRWYRRKYK